MAPKKGVDMPNDGIPDDNSAKKAKDKVNEGAKAVGKATKNEAFLERRHDDIFGKAEEDWDLTVEGVDSLDKEFNEEEMADRLRQLELRGGVDVRVMQVGPDGNLRDVSDKVSPRDLKPEQIA